MKIPMPAFVVVVGGLVAATASAAEPAKPAAADAGAAVGAPAAAPAAAAPSGFDVDKFMAAADAQKGCGDMEGVVVITEKTGGQTISREGITYTRGQDRGLVLLMSKPKTEAGTGYLRVDRNIWSYDPHAGQWSRFTARDRIAGTGARAGDLASSFLVDTYNGKDEGEEEIAKVKCRKLLLTAKEGVELAFPTTRMWFDDKFRLVKWQDLTASGALARTGLMLKRTKVTNSAGKTCEPASEIRIQDEVEKDRVTTIVQKGMKFAPVEASVFTKAWFESRSR